MTAVGLLLKKKKKKKVKAKFGHRPLHDIVVCGWHGDAVASTVARQQESPNPTLKLQVCLPVWVFSAYSVSLPKKCVLG